MTQNIKTNKKNKINNKIEKEERIEISDKNLDVNSSEERPGIGYEIIGIKSSVE